MHEDRVTLFPALADPAHRGAATEWKGTTSSETGTRRMSSSAVSAAQAFKVVERIPDNETSRVATLL
ncbi:MAG TPA: hypothetical protein VFQ48_06880 [Pseudonocardiaceae bacterium]|nr:hypothetical protein [Pseudonocardiaceae bacterium]